MVGSEMREILMVIGYHGIIFSELGNERWHTARIDFYPGFDECRMDQYE